MARFVKAIESANGASFWGESASSFQNSGDHQLGDHLSKVPLYINRNDTISVSILEGVESLVDLREDWEQLFRTTKQSRLTASWIWNYQWWQQLGSRNRGDGESRLVIFTCRNQRSELVGVGAFHYRTSLGNIGKNSLYPLGLRLLMPIGVLDHRDLKSLTDEPTYLIDPDHHSKCFVEIGRSMLQFAKDNKLDGALFEAEKSHEAEILQKLELENRRSIWTTVKCYQGSHVRELPPDWKQLKSSLSKKMRDKISYAPRFLDRNNRKWAVNVYREGELFRQSLELVFALHRKRAESYQGKRHNNYFDHTHQSDFMFNLATQMAAEGKASVAVLEVDEKVVAAQLFFEHEQQLVVTYSGFDPEYHQFSPLFVLICEVIKESIDRGLQSINFLVSGDRYQTQWKAAPISERHRYVYIRKSPLPLARFGAFVWARNHRFKAMERENEFDSSNSSENSD